MNKNQLCPAPPKRSESRDNRVTALYAALYRSDQFAKAVLLPVSPVEGFRLSPRRNQHDFIDTALGKRLQRVPEHGMPVEQ